MKIGFLSHLDLNLYLFRLPIMDQLVKKGHRVYGICPEGDKLKKIRKYGIETISYDISRKSLNPLIELKTVKNIYHAIKPLNLDILHNFTAKPNIYGTIAGRLAKIPIIINTITGLGSFYVKKDKKTQIVRNIMEFFYKNVNRVADRVIFQNPDDMNYFLKRKLVSTDKAVLIKGSGIDTEKFDIKKIDMDKIKKIKQEMNIKDYLVVLMVSRAIWDKGVREYYEAASMLTSKYPNVTFLYVGDSDPGNPGCIPREFLENGCVKWLGFREDILELTAICDIYVLPSRYREGIPRTLLEAASMSKPIVTTDSVGCREVVENGYNGFLVPIKNPIELAKKIEELIKNENLRTEMGKNGRKKAVKEFDVRRIVMEYIELYNGALREKHKK